MKRNAQRDEIASLLFGLTDKGVKFRNRWRGIANLAVWLALSGFTMIVSVITVRLPIQLAIVIGMSFLKYIPLLIVVYGLARKMAARYLDDIYELQDEELASDFLEEVAFGYGHEYITIKEGNIPEGDERSPIILIGGPGAVQVNLDSVALLEKADGEPKVIYPRNQPWRLDRFERIREIGKFDEVGKREYAIINLRDQFVSGLSVKSRSKDGIPLEAQGIKVIFSILRKQNVEGDHDEKDAYIFDENAVQALVYNQTIITPEPSGTFGVPFPWDTTVVPLVISELENLITSRSLSEILTSISQKEVDQASNNEQTIARMRVEMTGAQAVEGDKKETRPPNFESRSKITAQFFSPAFKEKAARIGVAVEWIDIGTWRLPQNLVLDKHKQAWDLARENEKKRGGVERSRKKHEMVEFVRLMNSVVIAIYERTTATRKISDKEIEALLASYPNLISRRSLQHESSKKDAATTALEILKAFRKELLAGKQSIENDNRPPPEKQAELERIEKALSNVSHLTYHYIKQNP